MLQVLDFAFVYNDDVLIASATANEHVTHPKFETPLRLSTDASNTATGAILEQFMNGIWQLLGFFSRKMLPAQTHYNTYDCELLVARKVVKHFFHTIEGRTTTLHTNNQP